MSNQARWDIRQKMKILNHAKCWHPGENSLSGFKLRLKFVRNEQKSLKHQKRNDVNKTFTVE